MRIVIKKSNYRHDDPSKDQCVSGQFLLKHGSFFTWEFAETSFLIPLLVYASGELHDIYTEAVRNHRCDIDHPWKVILAFDEFTPGDHFKPNNHRKVLVTSSNFLQLGPAARCHELTWFTSAILRSVVITKTVGGWSRLLRILTGRLVLGRYSAETVGIP